MNAATSRARGLCGALVGLCSGLLTAVAHVSAGGGIPGGVGAMIVALVCLAVGAATGAGLRNVQHPALLLSAALLVGQVLGHVTMTLGGHHGHGLAWPSAQMAAAHGVAAVLFGGLISLTGHLYAVCTSVVSWLRLVVLHRGRPSARRWRSVPSTLRPRSLAGNTRMRAPPRGAPALG